MRQVPAFSSYLVIGNGRMAQHFKRYLELEGLPFESWHRSSKGSSNLKRSEIREHFGSHQEAELRRKAENASHILLLISDGAIQEFLQARPYLFQSPSRVCVHFSGALVLQEAPSAHPLMTFSETLYDLETYRQTPFIIEQHQASFAELLPGFKNPHFAINPDLKGLYHAWCVLTGNFTVILWEKAFRLFEKQFGLPKEALLPYLQQTQRNLATAPTGSSVLTGPLIRNDAKTLEQHQRLLTGDPFRDIYAAFVAAYGLEQPSPTRAKENLKVQQQLEKGML